MQEFQTISSKMRLAEELEDRATQYRREIKRLLEEVVSRLCV
jgi:hypothetical protein